MPYPCIFVEGGESGLSVYVAVWFPNLDDAVTPESRGHDVERPICERWLDNIPGAEKRRELQAALLPFLMVFMFSPVRWCEGFGAVFLHRPFRGLPANVPGTEDICEALKTYVVVPHRGEAAMLSVKLGKLHIATVN